MKQAWINISDFTMLALFDSQKNTNSELSIMQKVQKYRWYNDLFREFSILHLKTRAPIAGYIESLST